MTSVSDDQLLEERLAVLARDPAVGVRRRSATEPFRPVIEATPETDILELIGRRDDDEEPAPISASA